MEFGSKKLISGRSIRSGFRHPSPGGFPAWICFHWMFMDPYLWKYGYSILFSWVLKSSKFCTVRSKGSVCSSWSKNFFAFLHSWKVYLSMSTHMGHSSSSTRCLGLQVSSIHLVYRTIWSLNIISNQPRVITLYIFNDRKFMIMRTTTMNMISLIFSFYVRSASNVK